MSEAGNSAGLFPISLAFGNRCEAETSIRGTCILLGEACALESDVEGLGGLERSLRLPFSEVVSEKTERCVEEEVFARPAARKSATSASRAPSGWSFPEFEDHFLASFSSFTLSAILCLVRSRASLKRPRFDFSWGLAS